MRYAVPVNAPHEVPMLAVAGATELYLGYQDAWWTERYGNHDSASRRQGRANLCTPAELEATTRAAHEHRLPVWLALNSRYTEPQLEYLVSLCHQFEHYGGSGVIASDLGLLWRLREGCGLARCLSILAVAQNRPTLEAFARLGVTRVVLPRFMQPDEAEELLVAVPGMEAEVMAFFDKCPWVDGYCRHRHGVTYMPREGASQEDGGAPLYTFDTTYQAHACLGKACTYLEPSPCAACHLPQFERAGVGIAKLGGRGRPLDERLRALRFLRKAELLASDEARQALYQQTFDRPCACYYGDATQKRDAIETIPQLCQIFVWQGAPRHQSTAAPNEASADGCASQMAHQQVTQRASHQGDASLSAAAAPNEASADGCASPVEHQQGVQQPYHQRDGSRSIATPNDRAPQTPQQQGTPQPCVRGSQTSSEHFWRDLTAVCRDEKSDARPMILLMPPLPQRELTRFIDMLPELDARSGEGMTLCANDLGTLLSLERERLRHGYAYALAIGTLLARMDDAREVSHALSPEENPTRPVWGPEGEPRLLTYRKPPDALIRHWQSPSLLEPSAQSALRALCDEA